ncbi:MAG: FtsX-like permease family protein [Caulobacterales bacterium]
MFRNYLATALRNLARNRLYAAISILGLAVSFAAAILIAQFVRNEFSYDRWIPGYRQIYKITDTITQPGQPPKESDITQSAIAGQLKVAFPGAVAIARLMQDFPTLRHNAGETGIVDQSFAWADPDIFKVLPLPALAGDLKTALQQPGTVVITREVARKYFGRDLPIGQVLDVQEGDDHHPMRVTAVLKDPPSDTNLVTEVFASARSAYSPLTLMDAKPALTGVSTWTYARLAPTSSAADLQRGLDLAGEPETAAFAVLGGGTKFRFGAVPLAEAHLRSPGLTAIVVKPTGNKSTTYAIATVGVLIVLVAAINFVTLMTARAARRAVEVGVRKSTGARRSDLIIQFMGEALIQVALAMLVALALAELLIRPFSAFVQRGLTLDLVHDPLLLAGLVGLTLAVGLLAGFYPALVLSSFRPAAVLKGGVIQTAGSTLARQALVVAQFAILIGLIITTTTIYRQTQYALKEGMGAQSDLILGVWTPCRNAFPDEVRRLPGVAAAACSSLNALNSPSAKNIAPVQTRDGRLINFDLAPVDFGFFEVFDIHPLAGRVFSRAYGGDGALIQPNSTAPPAIMINQTASRDLGYADPRGAIGRRMSWARFTGPDTPPVSESSEIVGVVPDMPVTVRSPTDPKFYFVQPNRMGMLAIRMTGRDMPGTVRAIERVWTATGNTRPIQEVFLSQARLRLYLDIIIQGVTISICAVLAVLIACLGLFALSAYTTERRTKEIGIRKVMGASTMDIVRLLIWQFTIPVLWSIAIALPLGFLVMNQWLHGFAYRVELTVWTFALAAAAALVIAWLTVSFQSYMVARANPAGALRYE